MAIFGSKAQCAVVLRFAVKTGKDWSAPRARCGAMLRDTDSEVDSDETEIEESVEAIRTDAAQAPLWCFYSNFRSLAFFGFIGFLKKGS